MSMTELPYISFIMYLSTSALLVSVISLSSANAQVSKPTQLVFKNDQDEDNKIYVIDTNAKKPQQIDPTKYLATLYFHDEEEFFPVAFNFNTTQDGNGDGNIDVEDNLENYIRGRIGKDIYNESDSIQLSKPNNQCLAVYFHHSISQDDYDVYEYWYYYAGDIWINKHEHDWETYFVYERNGEPQYIKYFAHQLCKTFNWTEVVVDGTWHPKITVTCGSHAIRLFNKENSTDHNWTIIRYDGTIDSSVNTLKNSSPSKWMIYSNDENVTQAYSYKPTLNIFEYGDPCFGVKEHSGPRPAPWQRYEWNNPPSSSKGIIKRLIEGIIGIAEICLPSILNIRDLPIGTIFLISKIYIDKDEIENFLKSNPIDIKAQKKLQVCNERQSFGQRYGYTLRIISLEYLTAYVINAQDWEHEIQVDRAKTALLLTKTCLYSILLTEIANRNICCKRPNDIDNLSFFSGNTSLAFASASVLLRDICRVCRELTGVDKYLLELVGLGTYVGAGYVGLSSIRHGEHYLSDVLFSAIIGIYFGNSIYSYYLNDANKRESITGSNIPQKSNYIILPLDGFVLSLSSRF
jgi:hypothetical protein